MNLGKNYIIRTSFISIPTIDDVPFVRLVRAHNGIAKYDIERSIDGGAFVIERSIDGGAFVIHKLDVHIERYDKSLNRSIPNSC
jgi:hypothetical protein